MLASSLSRGFGRAHSPSPLALYVTLSLLLSRVDYLVVAHNLPKGACRHCHNLTYGYVFDDYQGPPGIEKGAVGSGSLNVGRYTSVAGKGTILASSSVGDVSECCAECAKLTRCKYFNFFPAPDTTFPTPLSTVGAGVCYMIADYHPEYTRNRNTSIPVSILGGACNPAPGANDDPHFIGAHGTRFDFNGEPGKSFCFLTDRNLHINVLLDGYYANNEDAGAGISSSSSSSSSHHSLRTWIKALGILWRDEAGKQHVLELTARRGPDASRGARGFLEAPQLDGSGLDTPLREGESVSTPGGMSLSLARSGRRHAQDLDTFSLNILNLVHLEVQLRAAHPLLRTPGDAQVHFNVRVLDVEASAHIHGLLGQTYRDDRERTARAIKFQTLQSLLKNPIAADGETGKGFLDGSVEDYETSSVLHGDCKFAEAWNMPLYVEEIAS